MDPYACRCVGILDIWWQDFKYLIWTVIIVSLNPNIYSKHGRFGSLETKIILRKNNEFL